MKTADQRHHFLKSFSDEEKKIQFSFKSQNTRTNTHKMYKSNDIKHFTLTLTVLVISYTQLISAHVALTYPPARKYDLDFLDNSRTKGPCGMPKGKQFKF